MTDRKIAEVFPPGELIREELEARQWGQIELADILGRHPNMVCELISGKRAITPETAKALGDAFGTSAQFWMNLESAYQLWKSEAPDAAIARRSKLYQIAPIKEMIKRRWIEPSENIEVLENRVKMFFEINDLSEQPTLLHVSRKKTSYLEVTPSQLAWLFRAKHLACALHARSFNRDSIKNAVKELKSILPNADEIRNVPKILAEAGIRLVIIEHLPHTKIDGATFWLDKHSPVIALSIRYDRIDSFWYTLAHELGHIAHGHGLEHEMLDVNIIGDEDACSMEKHGAEKNADDFANDFLVDQQSLSDFIARIQPLYSRKTILGFAMRIKVHPGIVVGQLQYRKEIHWSTYRTMLTKIRDIITDSTLTDGWGQYPPPLHHGV